MREISVNWKESSREKHKSEQLSFLEKMDSINDKHKHRPHKRLDQRSARRKLNDLGWVRQEGQKSAGFLHSLATDP